MATVIRPQSGPQEQFLSSTADIVIYGGAAGGGKTYALLLDPLRYKDNPRFGAVILRKNAVQITIQGGLLDNSIDLYSTIKDAHLKMSPKPRWVFDSGASINFSHVERDQELYKWQGSQITMIGFDELTHFTQKQFFYMMSRNRSMSGIRPYIRATCNPDADSWVARFIEWWIDEDTGYPKKERSGKVRWMLRRNDEIHWADNREELWRQFNLRTREEKIEPKSVTFISSTLADNKILMDADPSYMANLKALPLLERERLLKGNWKIKPAAGIYFKRSQVEVIDKIPNDIYIFVRSWDLAATSTDENGDAAFTSGVLMGKTKEGKYVVINVINVQEKANDVRRLIKNCAMIDQKTFGNVRIRLPQDPGQAGKDQAESYIKLLSGFNVCAKPESGSKEVRAEPMAAQWQAGNFLVLADKWNEAYFSQLESFPESKLKDMVDAGSNAFSEIESMSKFQIDALIT